MHRGGSPDIRQALGLLPSGLFILTAAFDSKRSGTFVGSVQRCADEPVLISVACRKGHAIEPLIRDSHRFAVCQLAAHDRLLARRFESVQGPDDRYDPFDSLEVDHLVSQAPILKHAILAMDCEVFRHFDLESDHELYVGLVVAARVCVHNGGGGGGSGGGAVSGHKG